MADYRDRLDEWREAARRKARELDEKYQIRERVEEGARAAAMGVRATRLPTASSVGLFRASDWARQTPKQAIVVTLSLAAGVRLGASFPGLDGVLLGAHPHWLTHSALPVWAMRRLGKKFDSYLREREQLIADGELDEAERRRVEFERKMVRYVGAPLLGTFSCAAGLAMWAQILQPGPIVGAPISWLLGGNPVLDGIWLFANGVICMQQGYKFFMIALRDQEDAQRIVREIKGLLPSAATA